MTETSKNIPVSPHHSHPMIPACLMATAISHRDDYREMENHLQIKAPRPSLSTLPPRGCSTCLGLTLPTLMQLPIGLRAKNKQEQSLHFAVITVVFFRLFIKGSKPGSYCGAGVLVASQFISKQ